jgi:hypothetical protein
MAKYEIPTTYEIVTWVTYRIECTRTADSRFSQIYPTAFRQNPRKKAKLIADQLGDDVSEAKATRPPGPRTVPLVPAQAERVPPADDSDPSSFRSSSTGTTPEEGTTGPESRTQDLQNCVIGELISYIQYILMMIRRLEMKNT